jgi:hypothetical protein
MNYGLKPLIYFSAIVTYCFGCAVTTIADNNPLRPNHDSQIQTVVTRNLATLDLPFNLSLRLEDLPTTVGSMGRLLGRKD